MFLYKFFLLFFLITLAFSSNSEFSFDLPDEILIGKTQLQPYTNDLSEEGSMNIKLVLDSGKEYILSTMICRVKKGQFNWTPPESIPDRSKGHFEYEISVDGDTFDGTSDSIRFVNSKSTTTTTTTVVPTSTISSSETNNILNGNSTISNESITNTPNSSQINNSQNTFTTNNENKENSNKIDSDADGVDGNEAKEKFELKYAYYIGGTGIFVVALTGFFIFYKAKSKKNPNDYDFDSRPYNNTSMDVSQVLNNKPLLNSATLAPMNMNILGSPAFNNSANMSGGSQQFSSLYNNRNSNPMNYRVPNIESTGSGLLASPALSNLSNLNNSNIHNNNNYGMYSSPLVHPVQINDNNNYDNNNYEMMNTLDYNNQQNNGIINVNGSSLNDDMNIKVDIQTSMPPSDNYSANPRHGSLPRSKVPASAIAVTEEPLCDSPKETNYNNYRSSILSYISSNRGSFYGAAQAEHSVNHQLLNQICTVAYASQPENEDELYLCVGDKVKILEVYDDGWAYSLHISSGLEGMIPLNCTAEYY